MGKGHIGVSPSKCQKETGEGALMMGILTKAPALRACPMVVGGGLAEAGPAWLCRRLPLGKGWKSHLHPPAHSLSGGSDTKG